MKLKITTKEFNKLLQKERYYYIPFYAKYRKKRERNYCEECGHFEGYSYVDVGVGKPIGYNFSLSSGVLFPKVVDTILNPNFLIKRFLTHKKRDETISNNTSKK